MWDYINIRVERPAATSTCGWLPHSIAVISAKAMFVVMPAEAGIQALNGIARLARDFNG
ncbi:MAG TPA: hypothetical protein VLB06_06100 [Sulfuricaulis sp.]|nr:hypothetical protein [Sulfuricaulis sp.]